MLIRVLCPVLASVLSVTSPVRAQSLPAIEESRNEPGNKLTWTPNDVHALLIDETAEVFKLGGGEGIVIETQPPGVTLKAAGAALAATQPAYHSTYTSRVIAADFPFNDVVPSLNIDIPSGSGFVVELRLGRAGGAFWTRFYYLGTWGSAPRPEQRLLQDENGRLDQDYFFSGNRFDRLQYRVHLFASDASKAPVIRRFALAYSNTLNDADLARRFRKPVDPGPRQRWARRLDVPFRSQKWEHPRVRGSICSPTSVSMVLEFLGIYLPTSRVYETIWDPEYRLYGNWMRAVESAYLLGAPGYIERFGDWNAVRRHIARGEPVIASIRAERGQIRNSPYRESNGHLLVVAGFDGQESVHINDPAGRNPAEGMIRYHLEDMEKVWFGHGGVGYVLLRPGTVAVSTAR